MKTVWTIPIRICQRPIIGYSNDAAEAYAVEADPGAIGVYSHEFMVAVEVGEDAILFAEVSGYAANVETAATTLAQPRPERSKLG